MHLASHSRSQGWSGRSVVPVRLIVADMKSLRRLTMIPKSCYPICLHNKGLVADQTLRRCCASPPGSRAHNCFFCCVFFSYLSCAWRNTWISIVVINQNSALFVYDICTGVQTICSTVAFLTNQVFTTILINISSIFIHSHGCRVTALVISQILLLCRRYVTSSMHIRGHCNKYPWLVTFIVCWRWLWWHLSSLIFTCAVSLSMYSHCESVWVLLIIAACVFLVWSTFPSCLERSFMWHERKDPGFHGSGWQWSKRI